MRISTILLCALAVGLSFSARATTLNEIVELQMQLERSELQRKLSESRRDGPVASANVPAAGDRASPAAFGSGPAPVLRGVFGLGRQLYAIVDIGGSEVEFRSGDNLLGYRATRIDSYEAVLVGLDSNGVAQRDRVYRLRVTGGRDLGTLQKLPPLPGVPQGRPSSGAPMR
jgi:type IV pilus biogenesis protein PilP